MTVGSRVDIICSWAEEGSPPPQPVVRLMHKNGRKNTGLKLTKTTASQVHYDISSVQCEDAGTVTCALEGATEVRSTTLLVQCAHVFLHHLES